MNLHGFAAQDVKCMTLPTRQLGAELVRRYDAATAARKAGPGVYMFFRSPISITCIYVAPLQGSSFWIYGSRLGLRAFVLAGICL